MPRPRAEIKEEHKVKNGPMAGHVLYAGLLDAAHKLGLRGINTEIEQKGNQENGHQWVVRAVVLINGDGPEPDMYTGLGEASPNNVNQRMATALLRMAETRAKARALRDAINLSDHKLADDPEDDHDAPPPTTARSNVNGAAPRPVADRQASTVNRISGGSGGGDVPWPSSPHDGAPPGIYAGPPAGSLPTVAAVAQAPDAAEAIARGRAAINALLEKAGGEALSDFIGPEPLPPAASSEDARSLDTLRAQYRALKARVDAAERAAAGLPTPV